MSVNRLTLTQSTGELTPIAQRFNRTVACTQAYFAQHKDDPKSTSPFPDGCFIVIKDDTQQVIDSFTEQIYPIGSVYINALVDTNPATLFGIGVWTRISGKFLYGSTSDGELNTTGGDSAVTLSQANLPSTAIFTMPNLSGTAADVDLSHTHVVSIDDASTEHTHTTSATSTGTVTGSSTDWKHSHRQLVYSGSQAGIDNVYGYSLLASNQGTNVSYSYASVPSYQGSISSKYIEDTDLQHTHVLPALTTGGMSANSTHSHTNSVSGMSANAIHGHSVSIPSASVTITDFGSGNAFSIMPPYIKCNIWVRNA